MTMTKISDDNLSSVFPLIVQLRPELNKEIFIQKVRLQCEKMQYQLFGFYDEGELIGLCGVMPFFTLYHKHCLYICDFVIDEALRTKGYGTQCFELIETFAKNNGYDEIELSSSFWRKDAHRFYEQKVNMQKTSFTFKKSLC